MTKTNWIIPIIIIFGFLSFYILEFHKLFTLENFVDNYLQIKHFLKNNFFLSYFFFSIIYIIIVSFSIPLASVLTIAGGALFGWHAFYMIIISATIGATIVFIAAKTIFHDFFKIKTNFFYKQLETGFKKNDFLYLIVLRLIPLVPFWVVNVIPAFFNMKLKHYILATFLGIIPGTLIYVWFSIGFEKILIDGNKPDFSIFNQPTIIGSFTALGILILLPVLLKKHK